MKEIANIISMGDSKIFPDGVTRNMKTVEGQWILPCSLSAGPRRPPVKPPPEPGKKQPSIQPPKRGPKPQPIKDPPVPPAPEKNPQEEPVPIGDPPGPSHHPVRVQITC
jgi:hypothetical protein